MKLSIHPEILQRFPQTRIALVQLEGVEMGRVPDVSARAREVSRDLAAALGGGLLEHPHVASWRAAYRGFGTNPNNFRPSAEALARRAIKTGGLPRILPLVDAYNLVSLMHLVPAGAYDLDRLDGDVCLRFSPGGEPFTGIGATEAEHTSSGEVVYGDERSVLTRHWNHRDASHSRITAGTTRALVLFEGSGEEIAAGTLREAVASLSEIVRPATGSTAALWLDRDRSCVELPP